MFVPNLDFRPVARKEYLSFTGPDPWEHDRPTTWSVKGYQMGTATMTPPYPAGSIATQAVFVGIESQAHGRYRILPMALQDLWHEGGLRGPEVPALLHAVEEDLFTSDYPPPFLELCLRLLSITFGALTVLAAGAATWMSVRDPFHVVEVLLLLVLPPIALTLLSVGLLIRRGIRRRRLASRCRTLLAHRAPSAPT